MGKPEIQSYPTIQKWLNGSNIDTGDDSDAGTGTANA